MNKKIYTEKDIYEGMVLECIDVETGLDCWIVGKQYVVDKTLCIYDGDGDSRDIYAIIEYLNKPETKLAEFKVVEPEEKQKVLQLLKYTFGLKIGDVEEISLLQGDTVIDKYLNVNKKHITIPAYNTQQAIEYLTNELDYDINDIVSLEVK
ncbi:MAG: hypothetical protein RR929_00160 [Erysipelotrichaceae bacterium]